MARALANDPLLILADEPTAALDSVRGRQVIALFRQIADERGAGIAVVTHDPRALDLFDRTIDSSDGKLVGAGTGTGGLDAAMGLAPSSGLGRRLSPQ